MTLEMAKNILLEIFNNQDELTQDAIKTILAKLNETDSLEEWHNIEGTTYQVSNLGRIRNVYEIKPVVHRGTGYCRVSLSVNNKRTTYDVHRLVAKNFIPNPENKPQVNHKDGDKTNNCVNNLEWNTRIENMYHAYKLGLVKPRGKSKNHKCT